VQWVVADGSGNERRCEFTVTVTDDEDPLITCPSTEVLEMDAGECGRTIAYNVLFDDNCPDGTAVTQTAGLAPGSQFPPGSTAQAFTVTDPSGRTASCGFTITLEDHENPRFAPCEGGGTFPTATGTCEAELTFTATPTDNCPSFRHAPTGVTSPQTRGPGTHQFAFSIIDSSFNFGDACVLTFEVKDQEAPTITCPSNLEGSAATDTCGADISYTLPTFGDNCPNAGLSRTAGLGPGATFPVGVTSEEYEVEDAAGQVTSCSFTVTVTDDQDPTITCPADVTVNADAGVCTGEAVFSATADDNCNVASVAYTLATGASVLGSTFAVGARPITATALDNAGNNADCSFIVTVVDTQPPAVSCPPNMAVPTDSGLCTASVTFSVPVPEDNCAGVSLTRTGLAPGSDFPLGMSTVEYTATDASSLASSCSLAVTVQDTEAPAFTACPGPIAADTDLNEVCCFFSRKKTKEKKEDKKKKKYYQHLG
jgi:hypothetical protein